MNKITSYLSITFLGTCSVLYPFWIKNGYLSLDELYPLIGSGIAIYGGLIANIIWHIKNNK